MKTAEEYVNDQVSGPEVPASVPYAAAVAAVKAAIADAGTVGEIVQRTIEAFRGEDWLLAPATVRVGSADLPVQVLPFPSFRRSKEEEPPF